MRAEQYVLGELNLSLNACHVSGSAEDRQTWPGPSYRKKLISRLAGTGNLFSAKSFGYWQQHLWAIIITKLVCYQ